MNDLISMNQALAQISFNQDLFTRFIEYSDVKETTIKGYATCIRQFISWMQENGIRQPQREDIKAYKKHLEGQNFTAGTQAQYLRSVKHFFKWTASEGLYPNVSEGLKGARVANDNTRRDAFESNEILNILAAIDRSTEVGKRDYAMLILGATGALRTIEISRADIQDIAIRKGVPILFVWGKGRDGRDDFIKLVPEAMDAINDYLSIRAPYKKNDPLFVSTSNRSKGQRISPTTISTILKARFRAAGYDDRKLTAHSLRHTGVTLALEGGIPIDEVSQYARHSNISTTTRYQHNLRKEKNRSAYAVADQLFHKGKQTAKEEIFESVEELSEADQQAVLEYIRQLQAEAAMKKAI